MCGLKVAYVGFVASLTAWICSLQGCDSHVDECHAWEPAIRDVSSCEAACLVSDYRPNSSFYEWLGSEGSGKCRCKNARSENENDFGFYKICQDASYSRCCDSHVEECNAWEPAIRDVPSCEAACLVSDYRPHSSFYEWLGSEGSGRCRCKNGGSENENDFVFKICQDASYSK